MKRVSAVFGGLFTVCEATAAAMGSPGGFLQSKTVIIPKDESIKTGGEDSASTSDTLIAVSDGVGGWARLGIDSGKFSRELTRSALEAHEADLSLTAHDLLYFGCH